MKHKPIIFCLSLLFSFGLASAQDVSPDVADSVIVDSALIPAQVTGLKAYDTDNDHGHTITLEWALSADDGQGKNIVTMYEIFRWVPDLMASIPHMRDTLAFLESRLAEGYTPPPAGTKMDSISQAFVSKTDAQIADAVKAQKLKIEDALKRLPEAHATYPENGSWVNVGVSPAGTKTFNNVGTKERESADYLPDFSDLYYRVDAVTANPDYRMGSEIAGPVQSSGQWFNRDRTPVFFFVICFGILTVYFVQRARKGADLYVRPLAGIEAVDDAIGRATEMGRPILYVMGLGSADMVATIASFTILGRVAKRVAEYQTSLLVPAYDPVVMAVAQEVVKTAYLDAGRPDDYKEDTVHFVTSLQFAYVAAVNGIMLRELPATNVYMGKFFAESLLLAETGAVAGSIQIAGTDEIAQIPFFIVACDYTLIGEELYAASAYLGREPILLGSLKAQDIAKAAVIILAIIGLVAANLELDWAAKFVNMFEVAD